MASSSSSGVIPDPLAAAALSSSSSPEPEPKTLRPNRKVAEFVPPEPAGQGKPRQPLNRRKPKAAKPPVAARPEKGKKTRTVAGTFAKTVSVQFPLGNRAFASFTANSLRGLLSQLAKHGYDVDAGVSMSVDLEDPGQSFLLKKGSIIPMHLAVDETMYVLDTAPPKEAPVPVPAE